MLNLPASTVVDRRVAKEKFYSRADLTPLQRALIKERIESVFWRHKLATSTCNFRAGGEVLEIQVFEILLRRKTNVPALLAAIAKAIPYLILFALTFDGQTTYAIVHSGEVHSSAAPPAFTGATLDAVRDNLVRQLAGLPPDSATSLDADLDKQKRMRGLEKQIAALNERIRREPQEKIRHRLARERKELQNQLEAIK
jgi:hypothetical protein